MLSRFIFILFYSILFLAPRWLSTIPYPTRVRWMILISHIFHSKTTNFFFVWYKFQIRTSKMPSNIIMSELYKLKISCWPWHASRFFPRTTTHWGLNVTQVTYCQLRNVSHGRGDSCGRCNGESIVVTILVFRFWIVKLSNQT